MLKGPPANMEEKTWRIRSYWCAVFGSFGDSRKHDEEQWGSPGNPAGSEHTHSGWEARPLLEDETSKYIWVGSYRILFLEEKFPLSQERELGTLQGIKDASNFNILWTEASLLGNKTLTSYSPSQGNHLYLKRTPSTTHSLILLKEKWTNISISDQKKKKSLSWRHMKSLLSYHKVMGTSSVKARGTQSSCQNTGEAARESLGRFSWWGHGMEYMHERG